VQPNPAVNGTHGVSARDHDASTCGRFEPCADAPSSTGIWLSAIEKVAPVSKPCSTGTLSKAASASRRHQAASASSTPTSAASASAAEAALTPAGSCDSACEIISASTAAGPTDSTGLDPSAAYATSGSRLAYKPTCGGKPASSA
jgi:hypothetical protein